MYTSTGSMEKAKKVGNSLLWADMSKGSTKEITQFSGPCECCHIIWQKHIRDKFQKLLG